MVVEKWWGSPHDGVDAPRHFSAYAALKTRRIMPSGRTTSTSIQHHRHAPFNHGSKVEPYLTTNNQHWTTNRQFNEFSTRMSTKTGNSASIGSSQPSQRPSKIRKICRIILPSSTNTYRVLCDKWSSRTHDALRRHYWKVSFDPFTRENFMYCQGL